MTTEPDQILERILTATSPGSPMYESSQTDFAVQDAGLACAGMPRVWYAAALWRILADEPSHRYLYSRLAGIGLSHYSKAVRRRAGYIAALVLAEDRDAGLIERIGLVPSLLRCQRSQYYRDIRPTHLDMRGRLESWNRGAASWAAKRCR